MATYYWVGGSGNWSDATNHWANASGGSPSASYLPTSADDVVFDAASNTGTGAFTVTVNGTSASPSLCRDFSTGGAGGALGHLRRDAGGAVRPAGAVHAVHGAHRDGGGAVAHRGHHAQVQVLRFARKVDGAAHVHQRRGTLHAEVLRGHHALGHRGGAAQRVVGEALAKQIAHIERDQRLQRQHAQQLGDQRPAERGRELRRVVAGVGSHVADEIDGLVSDFLACGVGLVVDEIERVVDVLGKGRALVGIGGPQRRLGLGRRLVGLWTGHGGLDSRQRHPHSKLFCLTQEIGLALRAARQTGSRPYFPAP